MESDFPAETSTMESCSIKEDQPTELGDSGVFSNYDISPRTPVEQKETEEIGGKNGSMDVKPNDPSEPVDIANKCLLFKPPEGVESEVSSERKSRCSMTQESAVSSSSTSKMQAEKEEREDENEAFQKNDAIAKTSSLLGISPVKDLEQISPIKPTVISSVGATMHLRGDNMESSPNKTFRNSLTLESDLMAMEETEARADQQNSGVPNDDDERELSPNEENEIEQQVCDDDVPVTKKVEPVLSFLDEEYSEFLDAESLAVEEEESAGSNDDLNKFMSSTLANMLFENNRIRDFCNQAAERRDTGETDETESIEHAAFNDISKPQYTTGNVKVDFNTIKENGNEKFHLIVTFSDTEGQEHSENQALEDQEPQGDIKDESSGISMRNTFSDGSPMTLDSTESRSVTNLLENSEKTREIIATRRESDDKNLLRDEGKNPPRRRRRKPRRFRKFGGQKSTQTSVTNSDESMRNDDQIRANKTRPRSNHANSREGNRNALNHRNVRQQRQAMIRTEKRKLPKDQGECSSDKTDSPENGLGQEESPSGPSNDPSMLVARRRTHLAGRNRREGQFPDRSRYVQSSNNSSRPNRKYFSIKYSQTGHDDNIESQNRGDCDNKDGTSGDIIPSSDDVGATNKDRKNPFQGLEDRRQRMRKNNEDIPTRGCYQSHWRFSRDNKRYQPGFIAAGGRQNRGNTPRWNATTPKRFCWNRYSNRATMKFKNPPRVQNRKDGEASTGDRKTQGRQNKYKNTQVSDACVQVDEALEANASALEGGHRSSDRQTTISVARSVKIPSFVPTVKASEAVSTEKGEGDDIIVEGAEATSYPSTQVEKSSLTSGQGDGITCAPTSTQLASRSSSIAPYGTTSPSYLAKPEQANFTAPTPVLPPACRLPISHAAASVSMPLRYMLMGAAAVHSYYGANPAGVEPYYYPGGSRTNHCACCPLKQPQYNFM